MGHHSRPNNKKKTSDSVIRPLPLVSMLLFLCCLCWPDVKWQRFMFPAVSHTSISAWLEQQLDVYLIHNGSIHSETFSGGSPVCILVLWSWLWWWWCWWWFGWSSLFVLCTFCWSRLGWASTKLSSVGGGLWNNVRTPPPFCSCRAATPERPMSDTTRDTLQLDSLQTDGQFEWIRAAEQEGGDVSESCGWQGKICKLRKCWK